MLAGIVLERTVVTTRVLRVMYARKVPQNCVSERDSKRKRKVVENVIANGKWGATGVSVKLRAQGKRGRAKNKCVVRHVDFVVQSLCTFRSLK